MARHKRDDRTGHQVPDTAPDTATTPEPEDNGQAQTVSIDEIPQPGPCSAEYIGQAAPKPPPETKAQRFRRLAERRMTKAKAALRTLIPLANRAQYEYGQEEVTQIREELLKAIDDIGRAFSGTPEIQAGFRFR